MSDTIIKIANKTENFTIVSNEVPKDNKLSARAKGIYFYLMTLPKDWEIHKEEIYTHFTEGRDALDTAWLELSSTGYIEKEVVRASGKIVSNRWKVYESSRITEKPKQVKPVTGLPSDGFPVTDNPQLLNTNELSIKELKTNNKETEKKENPQKEIYDSYIAEYKNLFGIEPYINYPNVSKLITKLLQSVTKEEILQAINVAKTDDFCSKKTSFELSIILSGNVIIRLINESRKSFPSKPSSIQKKLLCPRCGSEVIAGLCIKCRTPVDSDGKELK